MNPIHGTDKNSKKKQTNSKIYNAEIYVHNSFYNHKVACMDSDWESDLSITVLPTGWQFLVYSRCDLISTKQLAISVEISTFSVDSPSRQSWDLFPRDPLGLSCSFLA